MFFYIFRYTKISPISILSLIYLLGTPSEKDKNIFVEIPLEPIPVPFDKFQFNLFSKYIIRSCISATYIMKNIDTNRNKICHCLWKHLLNHINAMDNNMEMIVYVLDQVEILIEEVCIFKKI